MKLQNLFIKHLASTAGIRLSKDTKSLKSEEDAWGQLAAFHHKTGVGHKGCCCASDLGRMCYGYFLRIRNLLNSRKQHVDKDTRLHYQLLLHQMNNALNR